MLRGNPRAAALAPSGSRGAGLPPSEALAEILTRGQGGGGYPLSGLGVSEEILTTRLFPEALIPSRPLFYEEILGFFHNLCS